MLNKTGNTCFLHCQGLSTRQPCDFLSDSGGTKLVMKQPPPYCHLVDKKEESDPAFQLPEETSGFGSSQGPGNKIGVYSVPVDGFQHLGWPACLSRNQASAGLLPAGPQQQA